MVKKTVKAPKENRVLSNGFGYGWAAMHPVDFAEKMQAALKRFKVLRRKLKFNAIAFTGSSGCSMAFYLAINTGIPLIYVRKAKETSHGKAVECNYSYNIEKYLIVDDFISSGSTVRRIAKKVKMAAKDLGWEGPECVGIFCYDETSPTKINIGTYSDDIIVDTYV
jgi:orotate phosphoribosyltransferase-like protein